MPHFTDEPTETQKEKATFNQFITQVTNAGVTIQTQAGFECVTPTFNFHTSFILKDGLGAVSSKQVTVRQKEPVWVPQGL